MSVCYECKENITYLNWKGVTTHQGKLRIDEFGFEEFKENLGNERIFDYYCPKCNQKLFSKEKEAINFLRNEE